MDKDDELLAAMREIVAHEAVWRWIAEQERAAIRRSCELHRDAVAILESLPPTSRYYAGPDEYANPLVHLDQLLEDVDGRGRVKVYRKRPTESRGLTQPPAPGGEGAVS